MVGSGQAEKGRERKVIYALICRKQKEKILELQTLNANKVCRTFRVSFVAFP